MKEGHLRTFLAREKTDLKKEISKSKDCYYDSYGCDLQDGQQTNLQVVAAILVRCTGPPYG